MKFKNKQKARAILQKLKVKQNSNNIKNNIAINELVKKIKKYL